MCTPVAELREATNEKPVFSASPGKALDMYVNNKFNNPASYIAPLLTFSTLCLDPSS